MARRRQSSKSRKSSKQNTFLPPAMREFLAERLVDGLVVLLFGLALASSLALISYSPADPSYNTASSDPVNNWLGLNGAKFADLVLQMFGLSSILIVVVLIGWAWRTFRERQLEAFWYRLLCLPLTLLFGSLMLSTIPAPESWPISSGLGGVSGEIMIGFLAPQLSFLGVMALPIVGIAAGIGTLFSFLPAAALSLQEWHGVARALALIVKAWWWLVALVGRSIFGFLSFVGIEMKSWRQDWQDVWEERAARKAEQDEEEPEDDENEKPKRSRWWRFWFQEDTGAAERREPTFGGGDDFEDDDEEAFEEDDAEDFDDEDDDDGADEDEEDVDVVSRPATVEKRKKTARRPRQASLKLEDEDFELPSVELLNWPEDSGSKTVSETALKQNAALLESVLQDFGVDGKIVKVRPGPVVTLYELEPAPGIKSSRVISLADDIARSMSAVSVRVAVVPGQNVIGIELPNKRRETVYLRELIESPTYDDNKSKLPLILGKDIGGVPVVTDLARMPHLLIAGTTGSGKSVGINTMILSLLYRLPPAQCRLIMIDPKMLELSIYDGIPHLLAPVVTDPKKAVVALKWAVREMEDRYRAMSKLGVRNIEGYNQRVAEAKKRGEVLRRRVQTGFDEDTGKPVYEDQPLELKPLPFIVVIVDEMADLMLVAGKDIEAAIQRLAQMARAAGIHLIMATQRPSVDVITGTVKANFPTRISFQVTSKIDSRTILGEQGAETLLGQGDMLYMAGGGRITRVHGPFVSDNEVEEIVAFLKDQGEPEYDEQVTADEDEFSGMDGAGGGDRDDLFNEAVEVVRTNGKVSTSFIQRRLQVGYNRAARIVEQMEEDGIVSAPGAGGRREVL